MSIFYFLLSFFLAAGEAEVVSWGYEELLLLVELDNKPAVTLYRKMGFREVFRDDESKASQVGGEGGGGDDDGGSGVFRIVRARGEGESCGG